MDGLEVHHETPQPRSRNPNRPASAWDRISACSVAPQAEQAKQQQTTIDAMDNEIQAMKGRQAVTKENTLPAKRIENALGKLQRHSPRLKLAAEELAIVDSEMIGSDAHRRVIVEASKDDPIKTADDISLATVRKRLRWQSSPPTWANQPKAVKCKAGFIAQASGRSTARNCWQATGSARRRKTSRPRSSGTARGLAVRNPQLGGRGSAPTGQGQMSGGIGFWEVGSDRRGHARPVSAHTRRFACRVCIWAWRLSRTRRGSRHS